MLLETFSFLKSAFIGAFSCLLFWEMTRKWAGFPNIARISPKSKISYSSSLDTLPFSEQLHHLLTTFSILLL